MFQISTDSSQIFAVKKVFDTINSVYFSRLFCPLPVCFALFEP